MVQNIIILLYTAAFFIVLLAVFVNHWVNPEQSHSKRLLSWFLLSLLASVLIGLAFHLDAYQYIPWAFKLLLPVSLLIYPLAYLYVRSVINSELKFRKSDWLLFAPAVLYFINLLPFYFMPIPAKKELILAYARNPSLRARFDEGILPPYLFPFFRVTWSIFFAAMSTKLIAGIDSKFSQLIIQGNKHLIRWLKRLNSCLWALVMLALYTVISNVFFHSSLNLLEIFLGLSILMICIQLFITPNILYGFSSASFIRESLTPLSLTGPLVNEIESKDRIGAPAEATPSEEEINLQKEGVLLSRSARKRYKLQIEDLFSDQQPYLQSGYSLGQMVHDTGLPRYLISAIINQEFGLGFKEFINRYRVEYFITHINKPEWQNLTLEAIANQCGFVSRSTFIKNFKEITGKTPSDFVKSIQK